ASRMLHTRSNRDWSSDVCSSDLHGYPEDLADINEQNLYQYYQKMLSDDQLDLYIMGDFESIDVATLVGDLFDRDDISDRKENIEIGRASRRERVRITQARGQMIH